MNEIPIYTIIKIEPEEAEIPMLTFYVKEDAMDEPDKANEALDYQTVENAIESLLPGKEWGDYFKSQGV